MDIFGHLRRYARVVLLALIGLVALKAIFCCSALDIILLLGLVFILAAVASGPC